VLNGTAVVAPETEQRVRAAIAQLNFSPHPAARQLVIQRTNTIGLLLPEISSEFFPPMLRGIEAGVREAGYDLLIHSTQDSHSNSHRPVKRPLREHNTDGLIVFPGSIDENEIRRLFAIGFPVVLLYQSTPEGIDYPVVTVENKSGAEKLVNHLIETHGRRRIAFLHGPQGHEDSIWREGGYQLASRRMVFHLNRIWWAMVVLTIKKPPGRSSAGYQMACCLMRCSPATTMPPPA
jgi:DNA-binding LacI/PurR family transcriptional regulator